MVLEYYSDVREGKLQKNVRQKIANELKSFNGKRIEIRIRKLKSHRSIQQNRYYWLILTILANEIGYEKNELHEIVKYKFLRKEKVDEKTGEIFEYLGSSTTLGKMDFADFISKLQQWSAETFNVILPDAGQQMDLL